MRGGSPLPAMPPDFPSCVAEIHGVDGPVSFPELLMQKIWASGEFDRVGLTTTTGEAVEIVALGRWNRLAGPDFAGARVRIAGRERRGDVELHLRAEDWVAHRHADDPGFGAVVLHVVLFPPPLGFRCLAHGGGEVPTLVFLPLLPRDLESYALDDAAERLANRALFHAREELGLLGLGQLEAELRGRAVSRWERKVSFARLRLARLGWEQACHMGALECLGYRFNRAAMAAVAQRWPLEAWVAGEADPERVWVEGGGSPWKAPWGRPSNHPRVRLREYARWMVTVPRWPGRLLEGAEEAAFPVETGRTGAERRCCGMSAVRERLRSDVGGGVLTGPRFDTLVCDHWLPLLAARRGAEAGWRALWFHWYPGDLPAQHARCLKELGVVNTSKLQPLCNGWTQGLLGWCIERESRSLLMSEARRSDS